MTYYTAIAEQQNGSTWRLIAKNDQQAMLRVVNKARKDSLKGPVVLKNETTGEKITGNLDVWSVRDAFPSISPTSQTEDDPHGN